MKYKEVTQDQVINTVIDKVVSKLPEFTDEMHTMLVTGKDGAEDKSNHQSLSDTVYCNLLNTMMNNQRPYGTNEIDRLCQFVDPSVFGSTVIKALSPKILEKTEAGYILSEGFTAYTQTIKDELTARAPMINNPDHNIMPWVSLEEGIAPEARMKLVTKSRGTEVSQTAMAAVNKLQSVKFIVSPTIANICDEYTALLDHALQTEQDPEKHDKLTNAKKTAKWLKWARDFEGFSFGVTMDWRTRMYYRAAHAQPQGSNLEKAAFQFEEFRPMSDDALEGIRIVCANELGHDKITYNERIEFMRHEGWKIAQEIAANPTIKTMSKYAPIDKCFTALVNCVEYVRLVKLRLAQGNWEGITSNLVCHVDGTCNGIQHAAALLRDRKTAQAVNCTASTQDDKPSDIYGLVANTAKKAMGKSKLAKLLTRTVCKKPVMVCGYGAGETSQREGALEQLPASLTRPERAYLTDSIIASMEEHAGAVVNMTNTMSAQALEYLETNPTEEIIKWRTADGCIVKQSYKDNSDAVLIPSGFTFKLSKYTTSVDREKMSRALSPNFVHSIDATHLRGVINNSDYAIAAVHDSIGTHPENFMQNMKTIRDQFVKLHEQDLVKTLHKWNGKAIRLNRTGDYHPSEARQSTYLFS